MTESRTLRNRLILALSGGASAVALMVLIDRAQIAQGSDRGFFAAILALAVFTFAFNAMAGPIGLRGAGWRALPLAGLVAGLGLLVSLRWETPSGLLTGPGPGLALLVLSFVPVPFLLAEKQQGSWRHYPGLFRSAWAIVLQLAVALSFTAITWLVIRLCIALLNMVGLTFLEDLIALSYVPAFVTGAVFGLGMAVVSEMADQLSPRLVHWLLRLLLPVVALVSAIFAAGALWRGFENSFAGLSPALTLLAMAGAGITLVSAALDESGFEATRNRIILASARAMSLMLPVLAGMALWSVWVRLADYGPTPNRLLVLVLALIGLCYGLAYAGAQLRGASWAQQIRLANPWLALGVMLAAALWLTPLMNAEAISARALSERLRSGDPAAEGYGPADFSRLGHAGTAALEALEAEAGEGGDPALSARLAAMKSYYDPYNPGVSDASRGAPAEVAPVDRAALLAEVEGLLPVSPASAGGGKSNWLMQLADFELTRIRSACQARLESGGPGCLMLIADLFPDEPGEEAVLMLLEAGGWIEMRAITLDEGGGIRWLAPQFPAGFNISLDLWMRGLMERWQAVPPAITPARINQIETDQGPLLFVR